MNTPINEAVERELCAAQWKIDSGGKEFEGLGYRYWLGWQARADLPPPIVEPVKRRDIFAICDAYESGVGHGLQLDGHKSGTIFENPECGKAYEIGYEEGEERARDGKKPTPANTLAQQVARAQAEVATWSPEKRASVRLEGSGQHTPASAPSDGAADARDAALEEAAKVCDAMGRTHRRQQYRDASELLASCIRALTSNHQNTGGENA